MPLPVIPHTKKKKRKKNPVCVHTTTLSSQFHVLHVDRRHCSPKFPVCLTCNVIDKKLPVSLQACHCLLLHCKTVSTEVLTLARDPSEFRIPGDPVTCGCRGTNHHLHHKIARSESRIPKKCCEKHMVQSFCFSNLNQFTDSLSPPCCPHCCFTETD